MLSSIRRGVFEHWHGGGDFGRGWMNVVLARLCQPMGAYESLWEWALGGKLFD